ncbi:argonaute 4 [Penaeus vannamei]|uniref:Argonaute 4 n=1 Tax=Penaeus vannamei TaxID=6689 RepID=A0A3R7LXY3_PENVA|nr:argonaute 4 [Penaeus vannamei]
MLMIRIFYNHQVILALEEDDDDPVSCTVQISLGISRKLRELMESLNCTDIHKKIPSTIFRMLDTMLRYRRSLRYEAVGKKRFFSVNREINHPIDIGPAVQGVAGFFSSMKASAHEKGSIMINIDHTEIRKRLECGLVDLRVETTHIPRTYRIIGLGMHGPDRQKFPWNNKESGKIEQRTVQDYFNKEYNKSIKYPKLICIQAYPEEKNIYLPLEYCVVARGQRSFGNLSNNEAGNFIRSSAIPPGRRLEQIKKIYNDNEFAKDEMIASLKFEVAKSPFTVTGRVLSPPKLRMGQVVQPKTGEWDTRREKFYLGAAVNTWAVIDYTSTWEGSLEKYIRNLRSLGDRKGMVFKSPVIVTKGNRKNVTQQFQNLKKKFPEIQMILVVLEEADPLYSCIKTVGDLEIRVITQCVKKRCVEECRFVTIGNLLFKINAKMGGINTTGVVDQN